MRIRHLGTAAVVAMILIVSGNTIFAQGSLTNISVGLSDNSAGAEVIYTFTFTTSATGGNGLTGIPDNGKIKFLFPAGFDVSGVDIAQSKNANLNGGFSGITITGQTVVLTRDMSGDPVPTSTEVSIAIGVVGNNTLKGSYDVAITTLASNGSTIIDTGTTPNFSIVAGPLHHFIVSTSGNATAGANFLVNMTAKDVYENTVTSFAGQATLNDKTGTIAPIITSAFSNGVRNENVTFTKSFSNNQITVSYNNKGGNSALFQVLPGNLDRFSFDNISSPKTAGTPFTIKITALDPYSNTVTSFVSAVALTDQSGSLNITSGNFTAGILNSQSINITKSKNDNFITAIHSGTGKSGNSNLFNLNPGNLSKFSINPISSPQTAGEWFSLAVIAQDQYDNTVTSFSNTVDISDASSTITPNQSNNFSGGKWTGSVKISSKYTNDVITVKRTGGSEQANSNSFNVVTGSLDHFTISIIASPKTAGVSFPIAITAKDKENNTVESFNGQVSISDLSGTISPITSGAFSNGVRNEAAITITGAKQSNQIIIAHLGSGKNGSSNSFDVNPNSLHHFTISNMTSPQVAGQNFAISIEAKDQYENRVTGFNGAVNLADKTATLTPTATGNFTAGMLASLNVRITKKTSDNQIMATDPSSGKTGQSNAFNVIPSAMHHIVIRNNPGGLGNEIANVILNLNNQLTLYAAGYDQWNNYIRDIDANWGRTGTLDLPAPIKGTSTTLIPLNPGTVGKIYADSLSVGADSTGTIQVGTIHHVLIRDADGGNGKVVNARTIIADDTLKLYAAAYDEGNNYLGSAIVDWSSDGNLQPVVQSSNMTMIAFNPTTAPASGKIKADHATATDYTTGTIIVNPGSPAGKIILIPSPGSIPANPDSFSIVTSSTIFDSDGNPISEGELFTIKTTLGAIFSPSDQAPDIAGHQVKSNWQSTISFTISGNNVGGAAYLHANSAKKGTAAGDTTLLISNVEILSIVCDQAKISQGQQNIPVRMIVKNRGVEAAIIPIGQVSLKFKDRNKINRSDNYIVTRTDTITVVPGYGAQKTLAFDVDANSNAVLDTITIDGYIISTVQGKTVSDTTAGRVANWLVQTPPGLRIERVAAVADTITQGTSATVAAIIRNNGDASLFLDSDSLTFWSVANGEYVTREYAQIPFPSNPDTIKGHASATLNYTVRASAIATLDSIILNAKAIGRDVNSNVSYTDYSADFIDGWRVNKATDAKITNLSPSQITVTTGQSADWYLNMVVRNNGGADLRIDSAQVKFTIGSLDISNQYQVISPDTFLASGDDTLHAGATDTLRVTIGQTGATIGTITIQATAYLNDMISGQVIDQAVTGIIVQSQAKLTIDAVKTSQPEATIAQTYPWQIIVTMTNSGGSDLAIDSTQIHSCINFVGDARFSVSAPVSFHGSKNFKLGVGETDSLFFRVDTTGTLPGNRPINVKIIAKEINSQRSILKEKNATIKIELPANIRITKTESFAPNAPYVDTDQIFPIGVIVQNSGQDAATDVVISLRTDSLSTILNPIDTLPLVEGGKSDTLLFNIQAASKWIMSEVFTASIDTAAAQNTPESNKIIIGSAMDSVALATVQRPAKFKIESVRSTEDTIRALTRSEWQINVAVQDSGAGFIRLNPPTVNDVGIYIDGVRQTDYTIIPPASLKNSGDMSLSWWESDTLTYRVTGTGILGGSARIKINLAGAYLNRDDSFSSSDSTGIYIRPSADVYIDLTEPFNCPNINQYGIAQVNTNQQFSIRSKIRNAGGERVDDVVVSLKAPGYVIKSDTIPSIPHSSSAWATFSVRAQQIVAERVNFVAKVETATSHESGMPASIGAASDSVASARIHKPALLKLTFFQSDTLFTSGQLGTVRAKVENLGTADVDSSGEINIQMPYNYFIDQDGQSKSADTTTFIINQPLAWQVIPPVTWSNGDEIVAAISKPPKDKNSGAFAAIWNTDPFATLTVRTIPSRLSIESFAVIAPDGAKDDTLSTFQDFWVRARISASENIATLRAALVLPEGYYLSAGMDSIKSVVNNFVSWKLKASTQPHLAKKYVKIIASGVAGQYSISARDSIGLVTKSQAHISIDRIKISSKDDSTLSMGQEFDLSVFVVNSGQAKVVGPANLKINFNTTGITTIEDTIKAFAPNVPVTWRLRAPNVEVGWAPITVSLHTIPADENTNESAYAPIPFKNFYIKTQHSGYASIDSIWITSPLGALDSELSTHQTFQIEADVRWQNCLDLPSISLQLTGGFTTPESNPKRPSNAGNQGRVSWSIKAPEIQIQNIPIWLRLTANDATSGNAFTVKSDSLKVSVVERAKIQFHGEILSPVNARDGVVSTGQEFVVGAFLTNIGTANLNGNFSAKILLPESQGYTIQETATLTAAYFDTIYWHVTAPLYEREAKNIQIVLEGAPNDHNTSVEVAADARQNSSTAILIQTEVKSVTIAAFSPRNHISSAKGDSAVAMIGLELICSGNVNSNNILLSGVKIKLKDRLNNLILDPARVISRIAAVDYQKRSIVYGQVTSIPSANPIEILFTQPDTLKPEIPNKIEFQVDILATTSIADFRLVIDSTEALYLIDEFSGLTPKLKSESGQLFTVLNFESTPTVIMESDFKDAFCCFPNPFGNPDRPYTKFIYFLDEDTDITFKIFTLIGELVWSRSYSASEPQGKKGRHEADIIWDGRNERGYHVLNGVYIASIATGYGKSTFTKIAVIK